MISAIIDRKSMKMVEHQMKEKKTFISRILQITSFTLSRYQ
jgi:hypothetical protein